jgi:hypothetical protein
MIRWTFVFENNNLSVEVRDEAEDKRISDGVETFIDLLLIPTVGKDAYINLKACRAIIREIVDEAVQTPEIPTQTTPPLTLEPSTNQPSVPS